MLDGRTAPSAGWTRCSGWARTASGLAGGLTLAKLLRATRTDWTSARWGRGSRELLRTASGRGRAGPRRIVADVGTAARAAWAPPPEIVLIGRRHLRSNNSWLHNVGPLVGGSNRCTLQINPADVARLGLGRAGGGALGRGRAHGAARTHRHDHAGRGEPAPRLGARGQRAAVAAEHAGFNVNALTDESAIDVPSGNAVFNGVPVTLAPVTT